MNRWRMTAVFHGLLMMFATNMAVQSAWADVKLPHVIGNRMVLQRDMPVPIWGWAAPGEEVKVSIAGHETTTKADAAGKWMVKLPVMAAGGPHKMTVSGKNTLELSDVLVGEVWVCSGQSNMEMGLKSVEKGKESVAEANYPKIRLFHLGWKTSPTPLDDVDSEWQPCSSENVAKGGFWNAGFSAVAYFFGREIHKELDVPVGLIQTTWGGTRIEPWTPRQGFVPIPALQDIVKTIDDAPGQYKQAVIKAVEEHEAWTIKAKKALYDNKPVTQPPDFPKHALDNNTGPTSLYNAMVNPLVPYAIRGAIWYQGESNLKDGMAYFEKMKALIGGWRTVWSQGEFPFYFVQLAPFIYGEEDPQLLPKLWEAQTASLAIPNTGMAVTVDIGNNEDIHPRNKHDVGHRLALWALAGTYGKQGIVYSSPMYKSIVVEGNRIRIKFDHLGGGLVSRDGKPLNWFEIAGSDKKFIKAEAAIDGDSVVVHAQNIAKPEAVRFAWRQDACPNLMSKEGLPASPFRTDKD